jgi:hypothetical protein
VTVRRATLGVALLVLSGCPKGTAADAGAPMMTPDAAAGACPGPSATGFAPSAWVAPEAARNDCTSDEIDLYWTSCLAPNALPIGCEQFNANHATCEKCLFPDAAAGAGPLRVSPGSVTPNYGGCIALVLNDSSVDSCGSHEQIARDCATYVCAQCSAGPTCQTDARQGACASQQMATCGELAVAAPCLLSQGAQGDFRRIALTFCAASSARPGAD